MIAVVWQFHVKPGVQDEFERIYGADGEWTALGRRSRSFLGSSFLRDQAHELHYMLIEYWLSLIHISEPTRHLRISYAVFCL